MSDAAACDAPFPYLGAKSAIGGQVWAAFGDVDNYVEPFGGSLAVLLGRPRDHRRLVETTGDVNGYLTNVWRAIREDPEAVASWASSPPNEIDLYARHAWLTSQGAQLLSDLEADPDAFDAKVAGWWLWGAASWIGEGWCDPGAAPARQPPRRLISLGNTGAGVERASDRKWLVARLRGLAERLRHVRITTGSWERLVTPGALAAGRSVGIYLDPPYAGRLRSRATRRKHYGAADSFQVADAVREWAIEHGEDPRLRIALSGYEDEDHPMPAIWRCVPWSARPAYGTSSRSGAYRSTRHSERLWLSPACLTQSTDRVRQRAIEVVAPRLHRIAAMPDAERRALAAADAQASFAALSDIAKALRRDAVRELHKSGLSYTEIGRRLGISRARAEGIAKERSPGSRRVAAPDPD